MKKNRMMRLASVLLVCVLLTTSVISGTFAKYITTDDYKDTARVAKFGVVATVSGDLFGATYVGATDNSITTYGDNDGTVNSSVDGKDFVVAPGTKNEKGLAFAITGTPEVSTDVTFDAAEDVNGNPYVDSEIYLKNGKYGIMIEYKGTVTENTVGNYYTKTGEDFTKATSVGGTLYELHEVTTVAGTGASNTQYKPLTWTYTIDNGAPVDSTELATVRTDLSKFFNNAANFAPNKSNAMSAKLTWAWAFGTARAIDNENIKTTDEWDTILGDMMAAEKETAEVKPFYVVVVDSETACSEVVYQTRDLGTAANNKAVYARANNEDVACLTVAFNARLTVEQVD